VSSFERGTELQAGQLHLETQTVKLHVPVREAKHGHGLGVPFDSPVGILLGEYTKAQAALRTLQAVIDTRVALCTTPSLLGGGAAIDSEVFNLN